MMTQRAALLGFVAFCFYLIAVVNTLPGFYFALTWLATGIFGASFGIALLSLIGLQCQIEIKRSMGHAALENEAGNAPLVFIALQNRGTLNKTSLILELRFLNADNIVEAHRFVIESVPSGASIEADLPLFHLGRGVYQLQEARIVSSDVLGLFRVQKRVILDAQTNPQIVVGPAVLAGDFGAQNGAGAAPMGTRRTVRSGAGEELRGTRPYAPGDDLRHVHWKSSARAGELVVKEWEQLGREAVLVVWDGAQNTSWGARDWDSTQWSLILAASLCRALLAGGTPCALARCDAAPAWAEARALSGGELPPAMVSALAAARARREGPLENALTSLPGFSARSFSTLFLISASLSDDLIAAARTGQGRGASVRVVLIDGASLGAKSGERRFRGRSAPVQKFGLQQIAVSAANYEAQSQKLRESGIHVEVVDAAHGAPLSLRRALRAVLSAPKTAFRGARPSGKL